MPQISVDLSQATDFSPIPEGDYWVEVSDVKSGETSTGKPKLTLTMEVMDGEYQGRKVFDDMILTGADALAYTKRKLEALFGSVPEGAFDFDTDDLIGVEVQIKVYHDTWKEEDGGDGVTRAKVAKFYADPGAGADDDLDDLFA